jgi:hypothetical protein
VDYGLAVKTHPAISSNRRARAMRVMTAHGARPTTYPAYLGKWCKGGKIELRGKRKRSAVVKDCKQGHVRDYFSEMLLRLNLPYNDVLFPSVEHLADSSF